MLGVSRTEVEARQLEHVRLAAARFDAVCLLKGRHTLVADPGGRVAVTTTGVPWLAVAGAGDVLAGVIGSLLASGLSAFDAAAVGSWLHGAAATYASALGARRADLRPRRRARHPRRGPHPHLTRRPVRSCVPTRALLRAEVSILARRSVSCCASAVPRSGASTTRRTGPERITPMSPDPARAEIVVDVAAIRHNVRRLREVVATTDGSTGNNARVGTQERTGRHATTHGSALMMTVVKADGYGHGMLPAARAARAGGADWLGVATLDEALTLRAGGDTGPILCWLGVPGEDYAAAVELGIDVTAYSLAELDEIEAAAQGVGEVARVQLKIDTGLSRGGCAFADWPTLAGAARKAEENGHVRVTGIWSHFACSDDPPHPANDEQEAVFREALVVADEAGLTPEVRHLANSAAAILRPSSRFDLVRCGIASYGLDPAPGQAGTAAVGLVPAMTVRARLAMVKRIPAGASVSYGHTWTAERDTTVALVPVGVRRGGAAGGRQPRRGGHRRHPAPDPRCGLHGPVRGRPR